MSTMARQVVEACRAWEAGPEEAQPPCLNPRPSPLEAASPAAKAQPFWLLVVDAGVVLCLPSGLRA